MLMLAFFIVFKATRQGEVARLTLRLPSTDVETNESRVFVATLESNPHPHLEKWDE